MIGRRRHLPNVESYQNDGRHEAFLFATLSKEEEEAGWKLWSDKPRKLLEAAYGNPELTSD